MQLRQFCFSTDRRENAQIHFLSPWCDRNAPPSPFSTLAFSQTSLIDLTDSSGVIGPLKSGAYSLNFPIMAIAFCDCSGVTTCSDPGQIPSSYFRMQTGKKTREGRNQGGANSRLSKPPVSTIPGERPRNKTPLSAYSALYFAVTMFTAALLTE